jgi:hypothetical protein
LFFGARALCLVEQLNSAVPTFDVVGGKVQQLPVVEGCFLHFVKVLIAQGEIRQQSDLKSFVFLWVVLFLHAFILLPIV